MKSFFSSLFLKLVGLSESGKSTLLKAVSGRVPLASGNMTFQEEALLVGPLESSSWKSDDFGIGKFNESRVSLKHGILKKLIGNGSNRSRIAPSLSSTALLTVLDTVDARVPSLLSTLISETDDNPKTTESVLLLLDEYVDKEEIRVSRSFWSQLRKLTDLLHPHLGVLAVTHQVEVARAFADSTLYLSQGSLLQHCDPKDLMYDGRKF